MQKRNITYSSDRSSLVDELLLLFWGKSSFYSACLLPETNSNVSARNIWLCFWASPWARGTRGYLHMNARGRDRIRNNELDGTDWTSCWFHTDYFITECLFSIRLTSFQSRHFQLSIDITPMSVCWVFAELQFILVKFFEEQLAEMEKTKSTSCLFSFFFPKPQSFVVFVSVHKKNRHFKVSIDV